MDPHPTNPLPSKPLTRRALLTGVDSSDKRADEDLAASSGTSARPPNRGHYLSLVREAMACEFMVRLDARPSADHLAAAMRALDLIEQLDAQLTVYRQTSEVIEINRRAAAGEVRVERQLFELIQLAAEIHGDTDGALDLTVGPLAQIWGFSRRAGRLPAADEISAALARVGFHNVELCDERSSIRFLQSGMEINFNSMGKGYALDRAAEQLDVAGVTDYLLEGGKSSMLASGDDGVTSTPGWTVGIRHPLWPQRRLAEVRLVEAALGTAGSATQYFRHRGRRYGHILDPRSGWPAKGVYSASAIAPTAAAADALATAFYVMGPASVNKYCDAHTDVGAILVLPTREEGRVDLLVRGLESDQWLCCDDHDARHNAHSD